MNDKLYPAAVKAAKGLGTLIDLDADMIDGEYITAGIIHESIDEHLKSQGGHALREATDDIVRQASDWMKDGVHIGEVRRRLFVSWDSPWNAWVRDMTADLEEPYLPSSKGEEIK